MVFPKGPLKYVEDSRQNRISEVIREAIVVEKKKEIILHNLSMKGNKSLRARSGQITPEKDIVKLLLSLEEKITT